MLACEFEWILERCVSLHVSELLQLLNLHLLALDGNLQILGLSTGKK